MFSYFAVVLALCLAVAQGFAPQGRMVTSAVRMMAEKVAMPPPPKDSRSGKDIFSTVKGTGEHTTLAAALTAAKLDGVLSGSQKYVLFAPTDAAFKKLGPGAVDGLLRDIPKLTEILKFHVSENLQRPTRNGRAYATLALHPDGEAKESSVRVTVDTAENFILGGQPNKAKVLNTVEATNGYVFPIDEVLLPYEGKKPPYMNLKEEIF